MSKTYDNDALLLAPGDLWVLGPEDPEPVADDIESDPQGTHLGYLGDAPTVSIASTWAEARPQQARGAAKRKRTETDITVATTLAETSLDRLRAALNEILKSQAATAANGATIDVADLDLDSADAEVTLVLDTENEHGLRRRYILRHAVQTGDVAVVADGKEFNSYAVEFSLNIVPGVKPFTVHNQTAASVPDGQ